MKCIRCRTIIFYFYVAYSIWRPLGRHQHPVTRRISSTFYIYPFRAPHASDPIPNPRHFYGGGTDDDRPTIHNLSCIDYQVLVTSADTYTSERSKTTVYGQRGGCKRHGISADCCCSCNAAGFAGSFACFIHRIYTLFRIHLLRFCVNISNKCISQYPVWWTRTNRLGTPRKTIQIYKLWTR